MSAVVNLFDSGWVAERYAGGRPNVHRKIAGHFQSFQQGLCLPLV
jgi:hypothetical protein